MIGNIEPGYFLRSLRMDELIAEAFAKLSGGQSARPQVAAVEDALTRVVACFPA